MLKMTRPMLITAIFACVFIRFTAGDVYLHNPRGSNNRLNGDQENRQNNNRLFDSQNNAKGGYNVGEKTATRTNRDDWYNMKYYMSGPKAETILAIEWTNQHGCGDDDVNCDIVLQYMCQPSDDGKHNDAPDAQGRMRNGIRTSSPNFNVGAHPRNLEHSWARLTSTRVNHLRVGDSNPQTGMHEPWEWYAKCITRSRNKGLFRADNADEKKTSSIYTRQNPNGGRSGYECPEERDYYPYWQPTPWTDIAVLTGRKRCGYYKSRSFNTKPRGECLELHDNKKPWNKETNPWRHASENIDQKSCECKEGKWTLFHNYLEFIDKPKSECTKGPNNEKLIWGLPYDFHTILNLPEKIENAERCMVALQAPDCRYHPHSRSNHLGNGKGAVPLTYNWALPHFPSGEEKTCVLRIRYNISTNDYDPHKTFADQNGDKSPIEDDPRIRLLKSGNTIPLQLAINTAQFGRTFQDRSHLFRIIPRENHFMDKTIHNLNVRGKRGNIVQAYPAVEYDFTPKRPIINAGDLLCIQWTGSNSNRRNVAGEGRDQTDRSNMVGMKLPSRSYPTNTSMFEHAQVIHSMDGRLTEDTKAEDLIAYMATSGHFSRASDVPRSFHRTAIPGCHNEEQAAKLDCYNPSMPGVLLQFKKGKYYYMCTRNNNFTNRSQKGRLHVK